MANAMANALGKKVLLANFPALASTIGCNPMQKGNEDLFRMIFREAKIQNAVVFFDECEALFLSRDYRPNPAVNTALSLIEDYDDIVVLATNRHVQTHQ